MPTRFPTEAANADFIGDDRDDGNNPKERLPPTGERPRGGASREGHVRGRDIKPGHEANKDSDES